MRIIAQSGTHSFMPWLYSATQLLSGKNCSWTCLSCILSSYISCLRAALERVRVRGVMVPDDVLSFFKALYSSSREGREQPVISSAVVATLWSAFSLLLCSTHTLYSAVMEWHSSFFFDRWFFLRSLRKQILCCAFLVVSEVFALHDRSSSIWMPRNLKSETLSTLFRPSTVVGCFLFSSSGSPQSTPSSWWC